MSKASFSAIILAAGKGTRMRSALPKVLHHIAGKPLIAHVLASLAPFGPKQTIVVIAPNMESVQAASWRQMPPCEMAIQKEQRGTGDAVKSALPLLKGNADTILILYGDTPLMQPATLQSLLEKTNVCDIAILGMRVADPTGYGRLLTDHNSNVDAIIECKDASAEHKKITLCNSGIMAVKASILPNLLAKLTTHNAAGEYYLTDIIALANNDGHRCMVVEADADELSGINTRAQLAHAEMLLQNRLRAAAMAQGVTLIDPSSVFFCVDTHLGHDVVIQPNVFFGAEVVVGNNVEIRAFSHIDGATIGDGAVIGPFARLRPGTELSEYAHVGNFVELKNTKLGKGAKASHLSYVGDTEVGEKANIGAGTITCNYDGVQKYKTTIGARAFIGSNSSLVAPVTIGDGAMVGAGSVITEDVPSNALAIGRGAQVVKAGKAESIRNKKKNG